MDEELLQVFDDCDYLFLENLRLKAAIGLSAFSLMDQTFPLTMNAKVQVPRQPPDSDSYALSYGQLSRSITKFVEGNSFDSLQSMHCALIEQLLAEFPDVHVRLLKTVKEGGVLRAESETGFHFAKDRNSFVSTYTIGGIRAPCIIGIYAHERLHKQEVLLNVTFLELKWFLDCYRAASFETQVRVALEEMLLQVDASSFQTVEALAEMCIQHFANFTAPKGSLDDDNFRVRVTISKPSALLTAAQSGVSIIRAFEVKPLEANAVTSTET